MASKVRQECDLSTLQSSKTASDSGAAASLTTGNDFHVGASAEMSVNDVEWHDVAKLDYFLFLFFFFFFFPKAMAGSGGVRAVLKAAGLRGFPDNF